MSSYRHLFGPVPSRRLGRSLGIDITPFKTCSFDCVFCQCGATTVLTTRRDEWVPLQAVCDELAQWLKEEVQADCITLAGSGEPTLYSRLGELIAWIKEHTPIPVVVLSNGTLLDQPEVRADLLRADRVKISLSAWDEASFQAVNRPAPELTFARFLAGARRFRSEYPGELWLEAFLLTGVNDRPEQVMQIAAQAAGLCPDRIHLNTAVRPPAEAAIHPLSKEQLEEFCGFFTPRAEVIAAFSTGPSAAGAPTAEALLDLLRRHPATADQLARHYGLPLGQLTPLLTHPLLYTVARGGEIYYMCREGDPARPAGDIAFDTPAPGL